MKIASMTGFGSGEAQCGLGRATVEIKSVNNRFCDVNIRQPREFSAHEIGWRNRCVKELQRGKVDVQVRWEAAGAAAAPEINGETAAAFLDQWNTLHEKRADLPPLDARTLMTLPGILASSSLDENAEAERLQCLEDAWRLALDGIQLSRGQEGKRLLLDLQTRAANIAQLVGKVEEALPDLLEHFREKLRQRWEEITEGVDVEIEPGRLEVEILALADKADVSEEITRLKAHLEAFAQLETQEKKDGSFGKSLDFLLQEFFREINTIGSKARDTRITPLVLEAKHELEKMREQAQNLL
jgi:uncharacterized protein (TIGR00255 family)